MSDKNSFQSKIGTTCVCVSIYKYVMNIKPDFREEKPGLSFTQAEESPKRCLPRH